MDPAVHCGKIYRCTSTSTTSPGGEENWKANAALSVRCAQAASYINRLLQRKTWKSGGKRDIIWDAYIKAGGLINMTFTSAHHAQGSCQCCGILLSKTSFPAGWEWPALVHTYTSTYHPQPHTCIIQCIHRYSSHCTTHWKNKFPPFINLAPGPACGGGSSTWLVFSDVF